MSDEKWPFPDNVRAAIASELIDDSYCASPHSLVEEGYLPSDFEDRYIANVAARLTACKAYDDSLSERQRLIRELAAARDAKESGKVGTGNG